MDVVVNCFWHRAELGVDPCGGQVGHTISKGMEPSAAQGHLLTAGSGAGTVDQSSKRVWFAGYDVVPLK